VLRSDGNASRNSGFARQFACDVPAITLTLSASRECHFSIAVPVPTWVSAGSVAGFAIAQEGVMSVKFFAAAIIATSSLVAASAYADDATPSVSNCVKMEKQVKAALESSQQSGNYDSAKREMRTGNEYCANGMYKNGLDHYASALKLIGAAG
jgi:hypothetical protein